MIRDPSEIANDLRGLHPHADPNDRMKKLLNEAADALTRLSERTDEGRPPVRYPNASTEPLDIIRVNECEADPDLATKRFQAFWNEIERLRAENAELRAADRDHLSATRGMETRLTERAEAVEAKLAEIEDRRDHTEGGLQLLLAAAKAGDPMKEIIFRIEEELRQLRRPCNAPVSAPVTEKTDG